MKNALLLLSFILLLFRTSDCQSVNDNSKIDIMLIRGDFNKVLDTCRLILTYDSLNSEVYYKMGLAYQNLLPDDKSFDCFLKAATISPENNMYNYMLARSYYGKGKMPQATILLRKLCESDSMNWNYAYYLTSIYMQDRRFEESLEIYKRFYRKDSANYIILDKLGFAYLRLEEFDKAIDLYNRSLTLNAKNINAIKNLSFLYASTGSFDTAIQLLTRGIGIDPSDMDLFVRRAALNFSRNYTKRAMDDYLKILASGDSSVLYLKRAGIGYSNNLQPDQAVKYLILAYGKDTLDVEVSRYLSQNFRKLHDLENSACFIRHIINTVKPALIQMSSAYFNLGELYKEDNLYKESIAAYLNSNEINPSPGIYLIIANLYDEKLKDRINAINYYQLFVDNTKRKMGYFQKDYVESVVKRLEYLKNAQKSESKK
jgi:tetratricopeptide (TPR) repeat protein